MREHYLSTTFYKILAKYSAFDEMIVIKVTNKFYNRFSNENPASKIQHGVFLHVLYLCLEDAGFKQRISADLRPNLGQNEKLTASMIMIIDF